MRWRKDKSDRLQGGEGGINEQGQRAGQREMEKGKRLHGQRGRGRNSKTRDREPNRERGRNKMGKATGHRAEREELINKDRDQDRVSLRMEKNSSGLQGRGRN